MPDEQPQPLVGDLVRITAPGAYDGQEAELLVIDGRRLRGWEQRAYKLLVKTDAAGAIAAHYFCREEFDILIPEEKQ